MIAGVRSGGAAVDPKSHHGFSTTKPITDYIWIFAGGEPPRAFLEKIGVRLGNRDTTLEASNAPKQDPLPV
jgi:hypothetical protein